MAPALCNRDPGFTCLSRTSLVSRPRAPASGSPGLPGRMVKATGSLTCEPWQLSWLKALVLWLLKLLKHSLLVIPTLLQTGQGRECTFAGPSTPAPPSPLQHHQQLLGNISRTTGGWLDRDNHLSSWMFHFYVWPPETGWHKPHQLANLVGRPSLNLRGPTP